MTELRLANKKDVWHLIQRGIITQFHFDFEAFGLNLKFAQAMSYGDAVSDIAGNYVGSQEIEVKRPDRYIPTPQALAVTRTSPLTLDEEGRWPHRVAMAKIAQRFEMNPLEGAAFGFEQIRREFETVRKYGGDLYRNLQSEPVVHYPLFDPDKKTVVNEKGEIVTDPAGMLKLNKKGEIVYGKDERVLTIPKKVGSRRVNGEDVPLYEYRPMRPEDGSVSFDVRIHPERKMISYRFEEDPKSPYYENIENHYYEDRKDGHTKWRFTEPRLLVSGYRIKWYDIPILRPNLVRAGFHPSNTFFTHSRATISSKQKPKNFSVDTFSTVVNTHLYGPQGEEGLKLGSRVDSRTGETVPSAKLELVMAENTRYENRQRGVRAGVFMPDGSAYDGRKGHKSPAYDAKASLAIANYCREIAPDVVKQQELQADEDYLREMLPGNDLLAPLPPIFAMMRSSYPENPVADPMAFIGFDDQQGQLRRAITVRLDLGDLSNFTYKGKTLIEMAKEDMAQPDPSKRNFVRMIKEQGRSPDSLVRIDSLRKFHGAVRIADALHTESAKKWDLEQIDDNFRFLAGEQNGFVLEAVRDAVEILNWEVQNEPKEPNPRLEEEFPINGFGDIDYLEFEARQEIVKHRNIARTGQTKGVAQLLYEKAMDVFKYHNTVDELMHRLAIQAHPVDLFGYDSTLNVRETVGNYWELFKKVRDRLDDKGCPYVHIFDEYYNEDNKFVPPGTVQIEKKDKFGDTKITIKKLDEMDEKELEAAIEKIQEFRWNMMKKILRDDEREREDKRSEYGSGLFDHKYSKKGRLLLANLSRDFRIIDERGRVLSIEYLKQHYAHMPKIVQEKLESKEWRIQFLRQTSSPSTSVILMQFADMGRLHELEPLWQFRYKALRALYLHGAPNEDASNMHWDAIPVLEKALLSLEVNHPIDVKKGLGRVFSDHIAGEADVFLRSEEGMRFIAEYRDYLRKIKKDYPMRDAFKMATGYDPATGLPYDWIEHEIDAKDYVLVDVPDPHLRAPLNDIRQNPYSLVIRSMSEDDVKRVRNGTKIVLRGMQTGRLYHPGKATVHAAPTENASYSDYFGQAARAYRDEAGVSFPKHENRQVLRIEKLTPVANSRTVDAKVQSLKVPALHFDGLVAPRLAHFSDDKPLTGLALPAYYCPQTLTKGKPIRFREMLTKMNGKMVGSEGLETGHTYETTLRKAQTVTVGELRARIDSGKFRDVDAQRYGYAGAHDMWEKINESFLNRESPDPAKEEVILLEFDPVEKKSWAYFNPPSAPAASFIYNGQPVSPSAYRGRVPNDNAKDKPKQKIELPKPDGEAGPAPAP